jgi:hypothetical protein
MFPNGLGQEGPRLGLAEDNLGDDVVRHVSMRAARSCSDSAALGLLLLGLQ